MKKSYVIKIILTTLVIFSASCAALINNENKNEFIIQGEIDTKDVSVSSKITGRIKTINVKEGDIVQKGDSLVVLDIPDILAQQKQAKAAYDLARQKFNRVEKLKQRGYASVQAFDEAYSTLMQTENKYKEITSYVDECTIIAPITGQIKDISVEEGELLGAGYSVITIIDTTDSWIVFNLREDLLSKIRMGSIIDVTIPALGKEKISTKVDYISAMGNYTTWRATKVRGDFDLKTFEIHTRPITKVKGLIAGMSAITDWNNLEQK